MVISDHLDRHDETGMTILAAGVSRRPQPEAMASATSSAHW
jgi:hypothetical protein